jgi:hypothetical protein
LLWRPLRRRGYEGHGQELASPQAAAGTSGLQESHERNMRVVNCAHEGAVKTRCTESDREYVRHLLHVLFISP